MKLAVLDASAVLAYLKNEPGAEAAGRWMQNGLFSTVNYSETFSVLLDQGIRKDRIAALLESLELPLVAFGAPLAMEAADLRELTRSIGLSLGDRACLALAKRENAVAVTADRAWRRLDLGIEIELIR